MTLFITNAVPLYVSDYVTGETLAKKLQYLESSILGRLEDMERAVDANGNFMREMKAELVSQRESDIYMFADQSERSDYASNLLKSNSVLITGKSDVFELLQVL